MNSNHNVVVIVGPTASGKSAVALELAKKTGGEIVNADSRQIYKHIAFGTSKPTPEEMASAPHHLYDFLEPNVPYSAGDYARDAGAAISGILERRRTPIVVGGTGLYIQSLFDGLAVLPKRDESLRLLLQSLLKEKGALALHEELKKVDPVSAEKIPYQNSQRTLRALEVYRLTGKPISEFHKNPRQTVSSFHPVYFGLLWAKSDLQDRIRERTRHLLPLILSESEWLLRHGVDLTAPAFQSLGYRSAAQRIQGKISPDEYSLAVYRDTVLYAKRQMTWFKRDPRIRWIAVEPPFRPERILEKMV